jgi:hypothetical protein
MFHSWRSILISNTLVYYFLFFAGLPFVALDIFVGLLWDGMVVVFLFYLGQTLLMIVTPSLVNSRSILAALAEFTGYLCILPATRWLFPFRGETRVVQFPGAQLILMLLVFGLLGASTSLFGLFHKSGKDAEGIGNRISRAGLASVIVYVIIVVSILLF